jgi:hypothetical protein
VASPIDATIAVAVIGPMPGTSAIFLHNADCFWGSRILRAKSGGLILKIHVDQ